MIRAARTLSAVLVMLAAAVTAGAPVTAGPPPQRPCPQAPVPAAAPLPAFDTGTSLLVVAPHPDDETLCCAGVIQRVLAAGGRVSVVWITSGDAGRADLRFLARLRGDAASYALALGRLRMAEARTAMARLGVPKSAQVFLGFPDAGMDALLEAQSDLPYRSPVTGMSAVPYADAAGPGHPYTRAGLTRDLDAVLDAAQPTLVLAPSPLDAHADHSASGRLAGAAAARRPSPPRVEYYVVHGGEGWPLPRGLMPGIPLTVAPRARGLPFAAFDLTAAEEDRKQSALEAYASQLPALAPLLLAFVRTDELFTPRAGAPR